MVENQRITAVMAGGIARIANPRYQHQRSRILVMASNIATYFPVIFIMVIHVCIPSSTLKLITDVLDINHAS